MKKIFPFFLFACIANSCSEINQIGQLEVVSTKGLEIHLNDPTIYQPSYSKKDIRRRAEKTIDEAIDKELLKHPGGMYMRNVRLYTVEKMFGVRYSIEGEIVGYVVE